MAVTMYKTLDEVFAHDLISEPVPNSITMAGALCAQALLKDNFWYYVTLPDMARINARKRGADHITVMDVQEAGHTIIKCRSLGDADTLVWMTLYAMKRKKEGWTPTYDNAEEENDSAS